MKWLVVAAWLAVAAGVAARIRGGDERCTAGEAITLALAATLVVVGVAGTLLAALGAFSAPLLAGSGALVAALVRPRVRLRLPRPRLEHLALAALIVGGAALRSPLHEAELAGRDQGTYVLQARHILATGALVHHDPLLAAAAAQPAARSGPGDILGLYAIEATEREPWRVGTYEGAYRPGLYLRERASGSVVPQFLQMHPTLLALAGAIVGPDEVAAILHLYGLLAALALWHLARRLWPEAPWAAALALALHALQPLVIWVERTPLSEALTGALLLAAALAIRIGERRWLAALLLGGVAWVRGNAWLLAPILLALLWLRPAGARRDRSPALFLALLVGSVVVHAVVAFPYLHDELGRQLGRWITVTPTTLLVGAPLAAIAWLSIDRALERARPHLASSLARLPALLTALALAGVAAYLALRGDSPTPPFARLDLALPAFGPLLLAAALAGLLVTLRRRVLPSADAAWWLALAALPTATIALYAQRNLPHGGLYYYGRYLVPELASALLLLAVAAVVALHAALRERRPRVAAAAAIALGGGLVASTAAPLVTAPITLTVEQAGTGRIIDDLAARIPASAVVIAGGEGWHASHTFNQVGGALAIGRGLRVLPYRSAEATYAALHELLVAGPAAGEAAPPVFLLLNEATLPLTAVDGARLAVIDDRVAAPFRLRPIALYELLGDRLTPALAALPSAITRAELRLGLYAVDVDPALAAEVFTWTFEGGVILGPGDLTLSDPTWRDGHLCLDADRDLVLTLARRDGPRALVLVARGGAALATPTWRVRVDGEGLDLRLPHTSVRERDTLGPFPRELAPRELRLRGSARARSGPCPHGALAELRLLPPDRAPTVDPTATPRITLAPPDDHGHPPRPTAWTRGRSLSRVRPGITPRPATEGLSLRLDVGGELAFPPIFVPEGRGEIAWVLHLVRADLDPDARLELWVDDRRIAAIDPPDRETRVWSSAAIPSRSKASIGRPRVLLRGAPGGHVLVRDLVVFEPAGVALSRPDDDAAALDPAPLGPPDPPPVDPGLSSAP